MNVWKVRILCFGVVALAGFMLIGMLHTFTWWVLR